MAYDLSLQEVGAANDPTKRKEANAQDPDLSEDEEATTGPANCLTAASEKSSSAEPSPSWCDQAIRGSGADLAPEETAVTHIHSSLVVVWVAKISQSLLPRSRPASRTPPLQKTMAKQLRTGMTHRHLQQMV